MCGDGKVQAQNGEECDDGNQIVTDACLSESLASLVHMHTTYKPSNVEIKQKWAKNFL